MDLNPPILYQWPPAPGVESIYPRCVIIHRIFNILNFDFTVQNVGLPTLEKDMNEKLQKLLIQLPVLQVDGTYYKSTIEIINFFNSFQFDLKDGLQKEFFSTLRELDHPLFQWANEEFLHSLLYARWIDPINYPQFVRSVEWGVSSTREIETSLRSTREQVQKYLKRGKVGHFTREDFKVYLMKQLREIDNILKRHRFLCPGTRFPSLHDLAVFMVIQGLLAPTISQRNLIFENYPHIITWAKDIERLTGSKSEIHLCLD